MSFNNRSRSLIAAFTLAFVLVLALALATTPCRAELSVGVGSSGAFSGRFVPVLEAGWIGQRVAIFGSSGGSRTGSSFYNAYQLEVLRIWSPGDFWWGKLTAGIGGGVFYSLQGYRPAGGETGRTSEWTVGPAIRLNWSILKPVFVAADCTFGIRNPFSILALSVQDIARLSVGIQL